MELVSESFWIPGLDEKGGITRENKEDLLVGRLGKGCKEGFTSKKNFLRKDVRIKFLKGIEKGKDDSGNRGTWWGGTNCHFDRQRVKGEH